jgi:hypothetical protein
VEGQYLAPVGLDLDSEVQGYHFPMYLSWALVYGISAFTPPAKQDTYTPFLMTEWDLVAALLSSRTLSRIPI